MRESNREGQTESISTGHIQSTRISLSTCLWASLTHITRLISENSSDSMHRHNGADRLLVSSYLECMPFLFHQLDKWDGMGCGNHANDEHHQQLIHVVWICTSSSRTKSEEQSPTRNWRKKQKKRRENKLGKRKIPLNSIYNTILLKSRVSRIFFFSQSKALSAENINCD